MDQLTSQKGLVIIELFAVIAILVVLMAVFIFSTQTYYDHIDNSHAISDIRAFDHEIAAFYLGNNRLPTALSEIPNGNKLDPWGNSYQYLDILSNLSSPLIRTKEGAAVNVYYDLYSKGKDGATSASIGATNSQDDIIRANSGKYIGLGENY